MVPGRDFAPREGGFLGAFDSFKPPFMGGLFGGRRSRRGGFSPYLHGNASGYANQDALKAQHYAMRANMGTYGIDPMGANYGGMGMGVGMGMGMGMGMPMDYYYPAGMLGGDLLPRRRHRRRRRSRIGPFGGGDYPGFGGGYPAFYDGALTASGTPPLICPRVDRYPRRGLRGDFDDYDDFDAWSDFDDDDCFSDFDDEMDELGLDSHDLPYGRSRGLLGGRRRHGGRRGGLF